MSLQPDLFGGPVGPTQPSKIVEAERRSLAMPCGFLDGSNKPCQRLGLRPVTMNGEPLVCRGVSMLYCNPECFESTPAPITIDRDDYEYDGAHSPPR